MIRENTMVWHLVEISRATIDRIDYYDAEFFKLTVTGDEGEFWLLLGRDYVDLLPHTLSSNNGKLSHHFFCRSFWFRAVGEQVGTDADLLRITSIRYQAHGMGPVTEITCPRRASEPRSR